MVIQKIYTKISNNILNKLSMEKTKDEKIGLVKELMEKLGVTSQEMIFALGEDKAKPCSKRKLVIGENVCVGMFWYYDNTFSFDLIEHKVVKAVVEYIDDEYVALLIALSQYERIDIDAKVKEHIAKNILKKG